MYYVPAIGHAQSVHLLRSDRCVTSLHIFPIATQAGKCVGIQ